MRTYVIAALIALVHLILALAYAGETPYRTPGILKGSFSAPGVHQTVADIGNPDERAHANYVQYLLDGKGFPVFKPGDGEQYEAHQPPAYYLLTAGFAKVVGVTDVSAQDGARLRWLNGLIGVATVLGAFWGAFWGFGRKDVALIACAFAAFLPMLCAVDGSISNDPLLFCTLTWALALLAKGVVEGWNWKIAVGVGVLCGVSLLTKTTALALLPTIVLAMFLGKRAPISMAASAIIVALIIVAPWWLRNKQLYGDPLAMAAFSSGFGNPRPQDIIPGLQGGAFEYWTSWFGWWTIRSFFGAFGYMDIFLNSTGVPIPSARSGDTEILYRLLLIGFLVLGLGWAMSLRKDQWKQYLPVQAVNGVFLALILILFLRFNMSYFQAQGRYVMPAIGPISCGIGVGLCYWVKDRWKAGALGLAVILFGVNLYALWRLPGEFDARKASAAFRIVKPSRI